MAKIRIEEIDEIIDDLDYGEDGEIFHGKGKKEVKKMKKDDKNDNTNSKLKKKKPKDDKRKN